MPAKVLIQDLWRCGCEWDEAIPDELVSSWNNWLDSLNFVEEIKIPRWYSPLLQASDDTQLHLFADSSEISFAAVAYLRFQSKDDLSVAFVASKTRIAPQEPLSIPRLELQTALLATRLSKTLRHELPFLIHRVVLWSDSQTVLGWLRSTHRRYSAFVSHRIGEILEFSEINDWRWVPTKQNVADDATKWNDIPNITKRWLSGPDFLRMEEQDWPKERNKVTTTNEEERSQQFHLVLQQIKNNYNIIDIKRFSNYNRLLRAVGFVRRYLSNLQFRAQAKISKRLTIVRSLRNSIKTISQLSGEELDQAHNILIKKMPWIIFFRNKLFEKSKAILEKL
jgi:hypothetical protein